MAGNSRLQDLWWPPFMSLYEALQQSSFSRTADASGTLTDMLSKCGVWLQQGLLGFKAPASEALSFLKQEGKLQLDHGQVMPIKRDLEPATLALSHHLGLNELQAYILVYRWSVQQSSAPTVCNQLLQQLEEAYLAERMHLLRSLQHLLFHLAAESREFPGPKLDAISSALDANLGNSLCLFFTSSLDPDCQKLTGINTGFHDITAASNIAMSEHASPQGQLIYRQQQALMEQELTVCLLMSVFEQTPCSADCFTKLMHTLNRFVFSASHVATETTLKDRLAYQAQMLSVQLLAIPTLLETIGHSTPLAADRNPLLVSGQDELCQVFISWLEDTNVSAYGSARLTQGHGPALLAFAATAALSRDVPSLSGPLRKVDAVAFAKKAIELAALSSIQHLAADINCRPYQPILLNLVCAVIAAFDLSPFSLPLSEVQTISKILAHLYEGHEDLCASFHNVQNSEHFRHAPVRHWYRQALQLLFETPMLVLQLWHSLASGLENAEDVANMLEASVSPTTRLADTIPLAWLDEAHIQTTKELSVPTPDGLVIPKGTTGKILPKPLYLHQQDYVSDEAVSTPMFSSSTVFVLWLPTRDQATAADIRQTRTQETAKEEEHMRPANNRVLFLGWTCLKTLKQACAGSSLAQHASTELLMIVRLFSRLAQSAAKIGQDILRVTQTGHHLGNGEEGADALDLACQIADTLCKLSSANVELLGATVELMAGLAIAYPGYVSTTIMGTQLLGDQATRVQHQQQEGLLTLASGLPMLAYIQESWENAHGQYPVTLAFLNLAYQLVSAGVNSGLVKMYVGFTLNHILASCHSWRFTKRSQKWMIIAAAVRVVHASLATPLAHGNSPDPRQQYEPDWSLARAVAEAFSRAGGPACYVFANLPPHADAMNALVQRVNREAETDAIELATIQWLQLLPSLIQACAEISHSSAFLFDIFQASGDDKPPAAAIWTSYISFAFMDFETASLAVLQACQAMTVASALVPHGQALLASCLLKGPSGHASTGFEKAFARHFQLQQAKSNPTAFAAASETLVAVITNAHPQLLLQLLQGSTLHPDADKENSPLAANEGRAHGIPANATKSLSEQKLTCLDGLWGVLQHSSELADKQPDILQHALHVLSVLWQAGEATAYPISMLRSQPSFLQCLIDCISSSKSDSTHAAVHKSRQALTEQWASRALLASKFLVEAHAMTILAIEAYMQPRQEGRAQADIWAELDSWASEGGLITVLLQHYTKPCWFHQGMHHLDQLAKELYLEAEMRLISGFAFMTHLDGVDLSKHTAGQTHLSSMWMKLRPVLDAFIPESKCSQEARAATLRQLEGVVASNKSSTAEWDHLTAAACVASATGSEAPDRQNDASLELLLHDFRELRLVNTCLQSAIVCHATTLPRAHGADFLYDEMRFVSAIGQLMAERVHTSDLQHTLQSCSILASVQHAQVQAAQALKVLAGVINRPGTEQKPAAISSRSLIHSLACVEESLKAVMAKNEAASACHGPPGMGDRQTDYAICHQAIQILTSQLCHWQPQQPASQQLPAPGAASGAAKPPRVASWHVSSRLANSSSTVQPGDQEIHAAEFMLVPKLMTVVRHWLRYQRTSNPQPLERSVIDAVSECFLYSLLILLQHAGRALSAINASSPISSTRQGLCLAAQVLIPELCFLIEAQSCHARAAAAVLTVMLRTCQQLPLDWVAILSKHLQLVTCLAQAAQRRAIAKQNHQSQQLQQPAEQQQTWGVDSNSSELEASLEGSLLALALHLAQTAPGAQILLNQGVTGLIPALAKWLLDPDGGGLLAASTDVLIPDTQLRQDCCDGQRVNLKGMYDCRGCPMVAHIHWLALLSLTGALVQTVEQDDKMDSAVISLMLVAQERFTTIVTPPEAVPHQPLTLALLQEVEKMLFLASAVPHLKGQWQMATQGNFHALEQSGGPFAIRQASCAFLEFAAVAANHQQHPCCLPVSPQEKRMAALAPQIPLAQAWFKATAVGSVPPRNLQLQHDPFGSGDKAAVAATEFSCRVAEQIYSCVMLALKLLAAFCPEAGPERGHHEGWPQVSSLKAMQRQCQALAQCSFTQSSRRTTALCQNLKGILLLSEQLLHRLPVVIGEREEKDFRTAVQRLHSVLNRA